MSERLGEMYRAGGGAAAGPCPPPEETARILLAGKRAERLALGSHAARCSDCAFEVRVALAAREAARASAPGPLARMLSVLRIPGPARLSLATAALALLLVPVALLVGRRPEEPVYRGARASAVAEPADGALLASPPAALALRGGPAGGRFRVTLFDELAGVVWESPFGDSSRILLPEEVRATLARGGTFDWRVARLDGARTWESPLFRFRVGKR